MELVRLESSSHLPADRLLRKGQTGLVVLFRRMMNETLGGFDLVHVGGTWWPSKRDAGPACSQRKLDCQVTSARSGFASGSASDSVPSCFCGGTTVQYATALRTDCQRRRATSLRFWSTKASKAIPSSHVVTCAEAWPLSLAKRQFAMSWRSATWVFQVRLRCVGSCVECATRLRVSASSSSVPRERCAFRPCNGDRFLRHTRRAAFDMQQLLSSRGQRDIRSDGSAKYGVCFLTATKCSTRARILWHARLTRQVRRSMSFPTPDKINTRNVIPSSPRPVRLGEMSSRGRVAG